MGLTSYVDKLTKTDFTAKKSVACTETDALVRAQRFSHSVCTLSGKCEEIRKCKPHMHQQNNVRFIFPKTFLKFKITKIKISHLFQSVGDKMEATVKIIESKILIRKKCPHKWKRALRFLYIQKCAKGKNVSTKLFEIN